MATSVPAPSDSSGVSVLVVDDDLANRLLAVRWLERVGLSTRQAETGEIALEELRKDPSRIGAVLLDVMMPGMSGYEVLDRMQRDPALRAVPVVMLTAHAQQERDVVHGLRCGAVDHLFKPFRGPVLAEKMKALLRGRQMHLELQSKLAAVRDEAGVDVSTGLATAQHFERHLASEMSFAARHQSPLALLLLEVQGSGQTVAGVLGSRCRSSEQPFRLSDSRFALLLRGAQRDAARRAQERVVAALRLGVGHVVSSIAVADQENGFSCTDLCERAQRNLTSIVAG